MNSKIIRIIALTCVLLALSLVFIACETDDTEGTTASKTEEKTEFKTEEKTEEKTEKATETEKESESESTTEESKNENVYKIVVVDESSAPVPNVPVQICQGEICLIPVPTNSDGFVEKALDADPSEYTVKIPDPRYVTEEYYTFPEDSKTLTITVTVAE